MSRLLPPRPGHLSVFASDLDTGHPVSHLPLYAEVAVPRVAPVPPIEPRLSEPIRGALLTVDPAAGVIVDHVEQAAQQALAERVDPATVQDLAGNPSVASDLFRQVFNDVLAAAEREHVADIAASDLRTLIVAALLRAPDDFHLALAPEPEELGPVWADPLGVLTTDHVGYASFDLNRLRPDVYEMLTTAIEARLRDPDAALAVAIWVYPYGNSGRFDAFAQGRFAFDAIVARLKVSASPLPPAVRNMGPRSLQNPGLTDWRLSPASFAASPKTLVGEDGCEELAPSNVALQEFVLRQVVRVTDPPPNLAVPPEYKAAYVDEYKVSWSSLGHSLGEILYSLPLAPGESVKLAVIDWSWDSLTKRDERTRLTEEVLHQTHRDRTITETVKAGLKELQHGSSFMAGTAGSLGATGGVDLGPVGAGAAAGNTFSLGGSTATSDGSRDLAAENVQRLSDSFSQASSAQREINSTVVIQARQEENESIQTRTFTNYNHGHTLTVLYYEVLRHFRVTVEWVRRRPAVLARLPKPIETFDAEHLMSYRFILEPRLLDPSQKAAFDLLEKQAAIQLDPKPGQPFWEGDAEFDLFELGITTKNSAEPGDDDTTASVVAGYVVTAAHLPQQMKLELHYVYKGVHAGGYDPHNLNSGEKFDDEWTKWFFVKPFDRESGTYVSVKWKDIAGFQFEKWGSDSWRIDALAINAFSSGGFITPLTAPESLRDVDLYFRGREPSSQSFTWINRPGPPPPAPAPVHTPEQSLSSEESHQIKRLLQHFKDHLHYYRRIVMLATDPNAIAIEFENEQWEAGQKLADHADPYPLEVFGSYIAYPLVRKSLADDGLILDLAVALQSDDPLRKQGAVDQLDRLPADRREQVKERLALASAKSERLMTLPTRGVFAEGKLGHCSVAEEIDNTRFWKWEEHPIPVTAPDIGPVTPITPNPQQVNPTPTPFPQSLVNIVNPSPAPDPSGLGAALALLGTPDIFRDMSGRVEVADLLKRLSDNTIGIAEAANRAREIIGHPSTGGTLSPTDGTESPAGGPRAGSPAKGSPAPSPVAQETAAVELERNKLELAQETLPPTDQKRVREASVAKLSGEGKRLKVEKADALPASGLTFIIQFNTVQRTTPVGTMTSHVIGLDGTNHFIHYPLINGGVTLNAKDVTKAGRIFIKATYQLNSFDDVVGDALGKAGTGLPVKPLILELNRTIAYRVPEKGNVISLNASPTVEIVKKKATTAKAAADKVSGELGANVEIINVKIAGESSATTSRGEEIEYSVYHTTGGLDVVPVK